jgi:DNA-binding transcriptional ArsR family regulator
VARRVLELTDPRAISAWTHPARQIILRELYEGKKTLTATECADLVGLTPSAVSYHLRALEKWGLAERADVSPDGRERPWRATADQININPPTGPAGRGVLQSLFPTYLDSLRSALDRVPAETTEDDRERRGMTLTRTRVRLTKPEYDELTRLMNDALRRYDERRAAHAEPDDAIDYEWYIAAIPLPEE